MELLIIFVALHVLLNSIFHISVFSKRRYLLLVAFVGAAFCYIAYPYAIIQNKVSLGNLFTDAVWINNLSIIYTIESLLAAFMSLSLTKEAFGTKMKRWIKVISYLPGLMIFGALFYFEIIFFFNFHSFEFSTLAILFSVAVAIFLIVGSLGVRYLIPEKDLRLEIRFILGLGGLMLSVILNSGMKGAGNVEFPFYYEWQALMVFLSIIIGGSILGFVYYHLRLKKRLQRIKK
ncbi:MAG: hypothetical protein ACEPOV_02535 [Hyphomicrobiales bacterium]